MRYDQHTGEIINIYEQVKESHQTAIMLLINQLVDIDFLIRGGFKTSDKKEYFEDSLEKINDLMEQVAELKSSISTINQYLSESVDEVFK